MSQEKQVCKQGRGHGGHDHGHDDGHHEGDCSHQAGPYVTITINNMEHEIHRGRQAVAEIKTVGTVPLADDLDQYVDGELKHLADDGAVTIKGCEVFVSHPKDGGAS